MNNTAFQTLKGVSTLSFFPSQQPLFSVNSVSLEKSFNQVGESFFMANNFIAEAFDEQKIAFSKRAER